MFSSEFFHLPKEFGVKKIQDFELLLKLKYVRLKLRSLKEVFELRSFKILVYSQVRSEIEKWIWSMYQNQLKRKSMYVHGKLLIYQS